MFIRHRAFRGCTFFLGSPGGADSSLRMLSRRPRTRSVGVRCFVLKKFMASLVGMGRWCARWRGMLRWGGRESGCGGEEHGQSDYSWVSDWNAGISLIRFPISSHSSLLHTFTLLRRLSAQTPSLAHLGTRANATPSLVRYLFR